VITTGVLGQQWRASVTPWGGVQPWSDGEPLDWYVAADDRWHVPADEPTVRQARVDGTPVVETRVRVPRGDVVQRVYSVADAGGITLIEVVNESTLPVAIAFDRRDVLTERPIADVPIEGIELPVGAFVLPLGHRATLRIGIPHEPDRSGAASSPTNLPTNLPTAAQVARGWSTITERASRLVLPDGEPGATSASAAIAARCELALGAIPAAADDPAGFAVALGELARMGESPDPWLPELVDAVERAARVDGWESDVALDAAGRVLAKAGETRALRDLDRIAARRSQRMRGTRPQQPPDGVLGVAWIEAALAEGGALLPHGIPDGWLGNSFEVYGVPIGRRSSVSFAVRWHGPRPAVLWEQVGDEVELTAPVVAPGWSAADASGETLWPEVRPPER
jgi:hypothetical protein